MSYRAFGGIHRSSTQNVVNSQYQSSNISLITGQVGEINSLIQVESDISGDIELNGNLDITGNLTAYYMFLSSYPPNINSAENSVVPKAYVDLMTTGLQPIGKVLVTANSTIENQNGTGFTTSPSNFNVVYPITPNINYTIDSGQVFRVDGIDLTSGNNVLLNYSINEIDNGVYIYTITSSIIPNVFYGKFTRSTTQLPTGSNAKAAYVQIIQGATSELTSWVQTNYNTENPSAPVVVGTSSLIFSEFYSIGLRLGQGLYASYVNDLVYANVNSNLNFLTNILVTNNSNEIQIQGTNITFTSNDNTTISLLMNFASSENASIQVNSLGNMFFNLMSSNNTITIPAGNIICNEGNILITNLGNTNSNFPTLTLQTSESSTNLNEPIIFTTTGVGDCILELPNTTNSFYLPIGNVQINQGNLLIRNLYNTYPSIYFTATDENGNTTNTSQIYNSNNGNLYITIGNANTCVIDGSLEVGGNITYSGTTSFNNLNVTGNSTIGTNNGNTFTVYATSTFDSFASFNGGVAINNGCSCQGNFDITGNNTLSGNNANAHYYSLYEQPFSIAIDITIYQSTTFVVIATNPLFNSVTNTSGQGGYIYLSSDYGTTWIQFNSTNTSGYINGPLGWSAISINVVTSPYTEVFITACDNFNHQIYWLVWPFISNVLPVVYNVIIFNANYNNVSMTGCSKYYYTSQPFHVVVAGDNQNKAIFYYSSNNYVITQETTSDSRFGGGICLTSNGISYAVYKQSISSLTTTNFNFSTWQNVNISANNYFNDVDCSSDGTYVTFCGPTNAFNSSQQAIVAYSNNSGLTFSYILINTQIFYDSSSRYVSISLSSTGQCQIMVDNVNGNISASTNYGVTWISLGKITNALPNSIVLNPSSTPGQLSFYIATNIGIFYFGSNPNIGGGLYIDSAVYISNMCSATSFYQYSDQRIKNNIELIDGNFAISKICQLRPVTYTRIWPTYNYTREAGMIAQEMEIIFPELVYTNTNKNQFKEINYIGLIPYLIQCIQNQQKEISVLQKEISLLKEHLNLI